MQVEGVPAYPTALKRAYERNGWWLGVTIIQAFDRTCDVYPDKLALIEGEQRFTFSQLHEKTELAARAFRTLGIAEGDSVLFQVPNWAEAVYIYLGLQRVGAVPIMCLPRHGQRELERFCALTRAKAWVGPASFGKIDYVPMVRGVRQKSPSLEQAIVVRDEAPPGMVSFSGIMEDSRKTPVTGPVYCTPTDPNRVMHLGPTGGTTGLPKLVPKTHNNHLTKSHYIARGMEWGPKEVSIAFSPLNHDAVHLLNTSVMALMGTTIVLCPTTKMDDILENIEREKVTYCFFVPALLADFLHAPNLHRYDISSLHSIVCGGAHCPEELARMALNKLSERGCRFHNCYGMTEGAVTITRANDPADVVAQTVGRAMCPYDEYKAVDESGAEVARGLEGELVARGPCIVSGYYKSEEENNQVFTPDGFFRTGDLARFDRHGNLVITGRRKDVINRGGEKVSAYDVEEMLHAYPGVLKAAVIGMPDARLGERICAYVQPKVNQYLTAAEILAFLKQKGASLLLLPERIELVPSLPVTAMDKVDKQALRQDIAQKLRAEGKI
ncbi:MAG: AMP-binding protein [Chloroflexi bacterium]|nr:AMP-binding protein [Chloroflexota bacterium]